MKSRILLVEDYPANVLVAQTYLDQFGYECDVASTGEEAIAKLQKNQYSAVLMDVHLGDQCGLELTRRIRAEEAARIGGPRLRIIAMTARALMGDRQKCLEAGMDDYISKPFQPQELQSKLAAA